MSKALLPLSMLLFSIGLVAGGASFGLFCCGYAVHWLMNCISWPDERGTA